MSLQISEESMLIVMSVYGGLVLVLCYDVIRVLRRIFYVGIVRIMIGVEYEVVGIMINLKKCT